MPFQPSPGRDHGYDVTDYYNVDPHGLAVASGEPYLVEKGRDLPLVRFGLARFWRWRWR